MRVGQLKTETSTGHEPAKSKKEYAPSERISQSPCLVLPSCPASYFEPISVLVSVLAVLAVLRSRAVSSTRHLVRASRSSLRSMSPGTSHDIYQHYALRRILVHGLIYATVSQGGGALERRDRCSTFRPQAGAVVPASRNLSKRFWGKPSEAIFPKQPLCSWHLHVKHIL